MSSSVGRVVNAVVASFDGPSNQQPTTTVVPWTASIDRPLWSAFDDAQNSRFFSIDMSRRIRAYVRRAQARGFASETALPSGKRLRLTTISSVDDVRHHARWRGYVSRVVACLDDAFAPCVLPRLRDVRVYLILTNLKKKFGAPLTSDHVNSGWCRRAADGSSVDVVVYRAEEASKVIVHELVHALLRDPVAVHPTVVDVENGPWPRAPMRLDVTEAVVETIASVVHAAMAAVVGMSAPHEPMARRTDTCLTIETRFADRQARRLLRLFDDGAPDMHVRSNALSYYVGKAALLADRARLNALLDAYLSGDLSSVPSVLTSAVRSYASTIPVPKKRALQRARDQQRGNARMSRWDLGRRIAESPWIS